MYSQLEYPNGAEFAFTILDDTDDTTVANGRPVYDFLKDAGFLTTKTVWTIETAKENQGPYFAGETLANPEYRKWVHELVEDGFELAFHNASMGSSYREETIKALEFLESEFDVPVRLHCNHGQNKENLYWGIDRYHSTLIRKLLDLYSRYADLAFYEGNNEKSPYYWADIAAKKIAYMRAFTFRKINGVHIPPGAVYRDIRKQLNPMLFNTADAPDVLSFNHLVNKKSIDKLHKKRGWAIISTHLGKGFYWNNKLETNFQNTMEYIAGLKGWFVPVSTMLDFIISKNGVKDITNMERFRMESSHLCDRIIGKFFGKKLY